VQLQKSEIPSIFGLDKRTPAAEFHALLRMRLS
jgi:hypothetical protein